MSDAPGIGTVEAIEKVWAEMMAWVDGRMSYTNTYAHLQRPDIVATMDAQEVVKRSAVIQALCAMQQTEGPAPEDNRGDAPA